MAYTVRDLVTDAYKECGVVGLGQTPKANESADALRTLNLLLDEYALDGLSTPGMRDFSVAFPAGERFVEFRRGTDDGTWPVYAVAVQEIPMRPDLVCVVSGSSRDPLTYMDTSELFALDASYGSLATWSWEDNQYPRLLLADIPDVSVSLSIRAMCIPYRDVDLNTDLSGWRLGLRPLLCAELATQLGRQNMYDTTALQARVYMLKDKYRATLRSPVAICIDGSAPGRCRSGISNRTFISGGWM